jgi:zinc protease
MHVERLENGLTLVVHYVPNRVVTIDAWVATGSAHETPELNGVSHFLEHMLFKGTERYAPGELDKAIMNVGGVWNAGTSKDFTHYYVTVAFPFFDTALDAISDMLFGAVIDPAEFAREKQVILEEYRRKQDNPVGVLYDELYEATYEEGPYEKTVLGSFESISGLERDTMFEYYRSRYSPPNIGVFVVGHVDAAEVLPKLRAKFDQLQPAPARTNGTKPTRYRTGHVSTIRKDVNETYFALSFPAPGITELDDLHPLDVASAILSDGRSSRLYRRVKDELRLVSTISAGFPTHRSPGLFYAFATGEREQMDAAIAEIRSVLRRLADEPPLAKELEKAKTIINTHFHFSTETNTGQSGTMGYYYTLTGSMDFYENYLDRINAVTSEQVRDVARKYLLAEPNLVVVEPGRDDTD